MERLDGKKIIITGGTSGMGQMTVEGYAKLGAKVVFFGATFKENCPDVRNSKVMEIVQYLKEFEIVPVLIDPYADKKDVKRSYGYDLSELCSDNDGHVRKAANKAGN